MFDLQPAATSAAHSLSSSLAPRSASLVHHSSFSTHCFLILAVSLLSLTGCGGYEPETPPVAAPAKLEPDKTANGPTASESAPAGAPAADGSGTQQPAAHGTSSSPALSAPSTQPSGAATNAAANSYPVTLSTGVALAQTGPDGVLMSFSVDYEFDDQPNASCEYLWVIKRSRGEPAGIPVDLQQKGTLQTLVPKWRPEEGPFEAHIVESCDGRKREVSKSIALERTGE